MSIVYNVSIEKTKEGNLFEIFWNDLQNNTTDTFSQKAEINTEEIRQLGQKAENHLAIGQKLFRFLDGPARLLKRALDQANHPEEPIEIHLRTCSSTANWPFELLAEEDTFLLPYRIHLIRRVSDWGIARKILPKKRPLRLLFMACSPIGVPELDFEREEEMILNIKERSPIEIMIEDSGSLEGLRAQLVRKYYDVILLSGHAGIDSKGPPFLLMEDEYGNPNRVFPSELWQEALIENPPLLLFLSGGDTGASPKYPAYLGKSSFAFQMVKNYNLQAVLGWGGTVADTQAIHAETIILRELSRGKSVLNALHRARYELNKKNFRDPKSSWSMLRLYSNAAGLNAIIEPGQRLRIDPRRIKHSFLKNSQMKFLAEAFVGRRKQIHQSLKALKKDGDRAGVLILGDGGIGKSCLAAKICGYFPDHTLGVIHGKLDTITLEEALMDAFILNRDIKGKRILSSKTDLTEKLVDLCATSFKERNYLLLLDDFDQNLEGANIGEPGLLLPEAADLLKTLLHYLPFSGKMTQMIITCRYNFSLEENDRDILDERLEIVSLENFSYAEEIKKLRYLENIKVYKDQSIIPRLLEAGQGNPRLMEWLDVLVGEMLDATIPQLIDAVRKKREEFMQEHFIKEVTIDDRVGNIEKRTKRIEQLLQKKNYERAVKELKTNLELIDRYRERIPTDIKNKNLDILKEYYTGTRYKKSNEAESEEPILKFRNRINFILEWGEYFVEERVKKDEVEISLEVQKEKVKAQPLKTGNKVTPYEKGRKLEKAVFELFLNLFRLDDSHKINVKEKKSNSKLTRYLKQKIWQKSGNQYGYDLAFTWEEVLVSTKTKYRQRPEIKCYVECKDYSGNIDSEKLFPKLIQTKANESEIDHWLLISPHTDLTPTAKELLDKSRKDFPFEIHTWTQESNVEELFGINPDIFEKFYILTDDEKADKVANPRLWTGEFRQEIIERWLEKLPPKYRLPNGKLLTKEWEENLENAEETLISFAGEDKCAFIKEREVAIADKDRACLLEDGSAANLFAEFFNWLGCEDSRILVLLGEFGSGKSLHSYSLGIETAKMFLKDPKSSRIPVRLTLKHCMRRDIDRVLKKQLNKIHTNYQEFYNLIPDEKVLFILDGFDEMSRYITQEISNERFDMLYDFCDEHKDAKILLTCRSQYFNSVEQEKEILDELAIDEKYNVKKLYLKKFSREDISTCINNRYRESSENNTPWDIQSKMESKYDLMGMSSNPLILSMVTGILDEIPADEKNVSQTFVYAVYVNKWIDREIRKYLNTVESTRDRLQEGVKHVMYELAYRIYGKEDFKLSFAELKNYLRDDELAALEVFNRMTSFIGSSEEEIPEGIKTRSFLVRDKDKNEFEFVHRSIMEYFIAEKLYQEILAGKNQNLETVQLSFEIIHFLSDLAMNRDTNRFMQKLQGITFPEKKNISDKDKWLGTNVLSIFYFIKRAMHEKGITLSGIKEDWSGITAQNSQLMNTDLSKAIFRNADLSGSHFENAILKNSDFSQANLTGIVFGETEDIVYSKWRHREDDTPFSIHSDGNVFKWDKNKKTPSLICKLDNHDILPPVDICFPANSMELFIGGQLYTEDKKDRRTRNPIHLGIENGGNFLVYYKDNRIIVFDVKKVNHVCTIIQEKVSALYLSYREKSLAYIVNKQRVFLYDMKTSQPTEIKLKDCSLPATAVAVNQEGCLYVGFDNGDIKCFQRNAKTNELSLTWGDRIHEKAIKNMSLNITSDQLLSCGADKKINIVDASNGKKKHRLQMLLNCDGMKIEGVKGLTDEKRAELIERGAVESRE